MPFILTALVPGVCYQVAGRTGEELPPRGITVVLGGDVLLDRGVALASARAGGHRLLADVAPVIRAADVALCNLESPACRAPKTPGKWGYRYRFHARPQSLRVLREAGFDVISVANNHRLDCGEKGARETLTHLRRQGLRPLDDSLRQSTPVYWPVRARRLAFLAFSFVESGLDRAEATRRMVEQIKLSSLRAEETIVYLHWGVEYQRRPEAWQRAVGTAALAAGAIAVVGAHPHVVQTTEWVGAKPLIYSLGNLLFDQRFPKENEGALARLYLHGGMVRVRMLPLRINNCRPQIFPAGNHS